MGDCHEPTGSVYKKSVTWVTIKGTWVTVMLLTFGKQTNLQAVQTAQLQH